MDAIGEDGEKMLETAISRMGLSARAHDRILKVARTIADLDASENLETRHLGEAMRGLATIPPEERLAARGW